MQLLKTALLLLTCLVLASCCLYGDPWDDNPMGNQPTGTIAFRKYSLNFLNKYQLRHSWFRGDKIRACDYHSDRLLEFPIHDIRQVYRPPVPGHFEAQTVAKMGRALFAYTPLPVEARSQWIQMVDETVPYKKFSKKFQEDFMSFTNVCRADMMGYQYVVYLKDWPIENEVADDRKFTGFYPNSTFDVRQEQRGNNEWTVTTNTLRHEWQNYSTFRETWYLPIADTTYHLEFHFSGPVPTEGWENPLYAKHREGFDYLINSVTIELLPESEKIPAEQILQPPIMEPLKPLKRSKGLFGLGIF